MSDLFSYAERFPPSFSESITVDAPVFGHDGVNYLMVGADKRHEDIETTPMTFGARVDSDGLTIESRLSAPKNLGGLVVLQHVVDTPALTGISVTLSGENKQTRIVVEDELVPLEFGEDIMAFDESFNHYIAYVFETTAYKAFIWPSEPKPPVDLEWEATLAKAMLQLVKTYTPEKLEEIERRTRPIFYKYDPTVKKVRRITSPL